MTLSDEDFVGTIPEIYEGYLVPLIFETYARDIAERLGAPRPASVLETAAYGGGVQVAGATPFW
jgi:hypothetical protein